MRNYGIPYMGSKQGIVKSIAMALPSAENFYDLFGGGFSVSHYMATQNKYKNIYYNEIKPDIVELVKNAISGKYSYDVFKPEWISKKKFDETKHKCAYTRVCWSFGNDQKTYMFGPDIEPYKKSMHEAVVFSEFDDLSSEVLQFKNWPKNVDTITKRRLYLRQIIEHYRRTNIPKVLYKFLTKKQLEQLEHLQKLEQLQQLQQLQQLEQLERLERLQQLERIKKTKLNFSSVSYEKVEIKRNSVVYCDIPYETIADYGNDFDRKKFLEWAASANFPVYISEYNITDDRFKVIYKINKQAMFHSVSRLKEKKIEKVYWNGVSNG